MDVNNYFFFCFPQPMILPGNKTGILCEYLPTCLVAADQTHGNAILAEGSKDFKKRGLRESIDQIMNEVEKRQQPTVSEGNMIVDVFY